MDEISVTLHLKVISQKNAIDPQLKHYELKPVAADSQWVITVTGAVSPKIVSGILEKIRSTKCNFETELKFVDPHQSIEVTRIHWQT